LSESLTKLLKESILNEALMNIDDVANELQVSKETINQWHKKARYDKMEPCRQEKNQE
jgi:transposase